MAPVPATRVQEVFEDWEPRTFTSTNTMTELGGWTKQISQDSIGLFLYNTGTVNTILVRFWNGTTFVLPPLSSIDLPFKRVVVSIESNVGGAHSTLLAIHRTQEPRG